MSVILNQISASGDESIRTASIVLSVIQSVSQGIFQPLLIWGLAIGLIGMAALLATQFLPQDLLNSE